MDVIVITIMVNSYIIGEQVKQVRQCVVNGIFKS